MNSLWSSIFGVTDEQAMKRLQSHDDPHAFDHLVSRWEQAILRLCLRMTGDAHRAEDLKQEVFARVYARRHDFRGESKFSTWLWRLALNLCYDDLRKSNRRNECPLELDSTDDQDDLSPDRDLVEREENALVREALLRLAEDQRTVLVLRYCEGLTLRDISEILQIPETTLGYRIAGALRQITRLLEPKLRSPNESKPLSRL